MGLAPAEITGRLGLYRATFHCYSLQVGTLLNIYNLHTSSRFFILWYYRYKIPIPGQHYPLHQN
uniref:Uncharacterized protein n=1 Tax=Rhizophora mucronata TaxID=61149 RepID=A0A2P2QTI9_RHIMU